MPPAPQQSGQDNSTAILWVLAFFFLVLGVVWYLFKAQIIYGFITIKIYEVNFINSFLNHQFDDLLAQLEDIRNNANTVAFTDVIAFGSAAGSWLRFPFAGLMVVCGLLAYFGNKTLAFKRTYSMRDFVMLEKSNWPQISPVVGLNLIKVDIDTGPWAMAMTPIQFCKKHNLLIELRRERREGLSRQEWNRIDVALKKGEANKVFALQLGSLWRGVEHLPPYIKALFAIFAARINADSKGAANMVMQLAASSSSGFNFGGVEALCKKHMQCKQVQKIIQSHAYVLTVMASMLYTAREDGVQASADFLWLKTVDRRLWYTLNTVGRQTPFVEVAGVFAHWYAEKEIDKRLIVPMVEEASKALELALKEIVYRPDEDKT